MSKLVAYKLSYIKIKNEKPSKYLQTNCIGISMANAAISPGALPTGKGLEQVFDL